MPEPDLNFVLRRLDAFQKELREGLALMELRDERREASYQTAIQILTRLMASIATTVEDRLNGLDDRLNGLDVRLNAIDARLARLETTLSDIARKLSDTEQLGAARAPDRPKAAPF
jgi:hypothetical protein